MLAISWAGCGVLATLLVLQWWRIKDPVVTDPAGKPTVQNTAEKPNAIVLNGSRLESNATSVEASSYPSPIAPAVFTAPTFNQQAHDIPLPHGLETVPLSAPYPRLSMASHSTLIQPAEVLQDQLPTPIEATSFPADLPSVPNLEVMEPEKLTRIESNPHNNLVTVSVRGAPLHSVLSLVAEQQGLSIAAPSALETPITLSLQPTTLENALNAITSISGCTWTRVHDVIYVTPIKQDSPENFLIQGRELRVFNLGYASATDVEKTITGLLSPIGKVFVRVTDSKDKRKSSEQIVVEDLPDYLARIADYISQADLPPRQVMVEARILQVKLENDNRHGVNFDTLARVAGADITFKSQALASGLGTAGVVTVDGTDFNSLLDCLVTNNDSKTLATPKLMMINGQESRIQIGRKLGYFVTTTTQTSTLQDVKFLEVGVVLTVTPQITEDGRIVMKVHPKVSTGDINPTTTLPDEETTEVDTTVMVGDGRGIIIGGLIQEIDNERQNKLPFLGDLWLVGRLFQRRVAERERNEVIVALLPHIVPLDGCLSPQEVEEYQRVDMPLLTPTLESAPRPEAKLHDAIRKPKRAWDWRPQ